MRVYGNIIFIEPFPVYCSIHTDVCVGSFTCVRECKHNINYNKASRTVECKKAANLFLREKKLKRIIK